MTELSDWLLGQIAADEDEAEHMCGPCDCDLPGFPLQHGLSCKVRVLAECEAKRRIVEMWQQLVAEHESLQDPYSMGRQWGIYLAVCALASVYADHTDYRQEWR